PRVDEGTDMAGIAQVRGEGREGLPDAAPLHHRRLGGVAPVDRVPHHGPDDAKPLHTSPHLCLMNAAAAPYTPAVPVSAPGTMRHASTAGLKARRFTSPRSGANSFSPASVTPPQITTTSGLQILTILATPVPRNFAVSCTTSRAYSSPSCAASYTICAVILDSSPFT